MPEESLTRWLLLQEAVVAFDEDRARSLAGQVLTEGLDVRQAVMSGLVAGLNQTGALYDQGEYFLPELVMAAEAFLAGLEALAPGLVRAAGQGFPRGWLLLGSGEEKIEAFSRRLLTAFFSQVGLEIRDLAAGVRLEDYLRDNLQPGLDVLCLPLHLNAVQLDPAKLVELIRELSPRTVPLLGYSWSMDESPESSWSEPGFFPTGNPLREAVALIAGYSKVLGPA
ncbi:MAG: B12-binding domain-containing protein [Thermodesulfobacteriota bacterium]